MINRTPLEILRAEFGTYANMAQKLGITAQAIYRWKKQRIPIEHIKTIHRVTDGRLTLNMLRPDLKELQ
jgi:DNA-binding transcriptional regulator YdaS (Cro superfamily)